MAGPLILAVYLEVNFSFQVSGLHVSFCYLYDNPLFFVYSREEGTVKYDDVSFSCIVGGDRAMPLIFLVRRTLFFSLKPLLRIFATPFLFLYVLAAKYCIV